MPRDLMREWRIVDDGCFSKHGYVDRSFHNISITLLQPSCYIINHAITIVKAFAIKIFSLNQGSARKLNRRIGRLCKARRKNPSGWPPQQTIPPTRRHGPLQRRGLQPQTQYQGLRMIEMLKIHSRRSRRMGLQRTGLQMARARRNLRMMQHQK